MDFQHTRRVITKWCKKCGLQFYTRTRTQKYCREHSTRAKMTGLGEVATQQDYQQQKELD